MAQRLNLNVTTLVGGRTKQKMLNPPIEYCDILVTTLGAYSKLVSTGIFKINNVHHIVLDEADTLLDDSFIDKVSHLLKKFPVSRIIIFTYTILLISQSLLLNIKETLSGSCPNHCLLAMPLFFCLFFLF